MRAYRRFTIALIWSIVVSLVSAMPQTAPLDTAKQAF